MSEAKAEKEKVAAKIKRVNFIGTPFMVQLINEV
jgi:hypothetical protein